MGKINSAWGGATPLLQDLTKDQREAGWPEYFKPRQVACLQIPWMRGDRASIAATNAFASNVIEPACKRGDLLTETVTMSLPCTETRWVAGDPSFYVRNWEGEKVVKPRQINVTVSKDKPVVVITAQAFKAWLMADGAAPSKHVQAWFDAVLIASTPVTAAVPPGESLADRNDRWLTYFETEEKREPVGANNRSATHFNAEPSTFRKAVKKAKELRAEKYRAGIKSVPGKPKKPASMYSQLIVPDSKKTNR